MNILEELGLKYGTDKIGKHHYLPIYHEMFKDRRNKVKKVLEIGPAEGAGLKMLRDYFPNATIYGAEIDQDRVYKLQGLERIEVFKCDQSEIVDLYKILDLAGKDLDIVIDDGSHKPEDQLFTAINLISMLRKGAIYIIEDVADSSLLEKLNFYFKCDLLRVGKRYDDQIIICKK